jgi:hypothetical protein
MRMAMLTPAPDYGAEWKWAFEAQARALRKGGAQVVPLPWTAADDLADFDLILPLVTWGYHLKHDEWLAFLDRLEAERRPMLIQPWLDAVVSEGEYSLIFFGGTFSHCVAKRPKAGDFRVQPDHGGSTTAVDVPEGALAVAEAALAAAPTSALYARVDLIRGTDGTLQVMELELIEPALFLHCVPEAEARFAAAVLSSPERRA